MNQAQVTNGREERVCKGLEPSASRALGEDFLGTEFKTKVLLPLRQEVKAEDVVGPFQLGLFNLLASHAANVEFWQGTAAVVWGAEIAGHIEQVPWRQKQVH